MQISRMLLQLRYEYKDHKDLAQSNLQTMLEAIDSLSIHPKNKLLI